MNIWMWLIIGFLTGLVVAAIINLLFKGGSSEEPQKSVNDETADLAKAEVKIAVLEDKLRQAEEDKITLRAELEAEYEDKLTAAEADYRVQLAILEAEKKEKTLNESKAELEREAALLDDNVDEVLIPEVDSEEVSIGNVAAVAAGAVVATNIPGEDDEQGDFEEINEEASSDESIKSGLEAEESSESITADSEEKPNDLFQSDDADNNDSALIVEKQDAESGANGENEEIDERDGASAAALAIGSAVMLADDSEAEALDVEEGSVAETVTADIIDVADEDPSIDESYSEDELEYDERELDSASRMNTAGIGATGLVMSNDESVEEPGIEVNIEGESAKELETEVDVEDDFTDESEINDKVDDETTQELEPGDYVEYETPHELETDGDVGDLEEELEEETTEAVVLEWPEDDSVWRGEYFNNMGLEGDPVIVREDSDIDFDWGFGSPAPEIDVDNFSVRWTRKAEFPPGLYRFTVTSDDGVRLWVNERLVISAWYDHSQMTFRREMTLPGGAVNLRLEYYEKDMAALVKCYWERIG